MTAAVGTRPNKGPVTIVSASRLPSLCRLFEFEDDAENEFQARSMAAAAEIHAWYHQPDVWQGELRAMWEAEADERGYAPQWSPTSDRGFARWVGMEVEKAGLTLHRRTIQRLFYAAMMREVVLAELAPGGATSISLPETEGAWRPAMRLYSKGFKTEIVDAVKIASRIADDEAQPITAGIMRKAVAEVWRTAPRVRTWVEQPGQTHDPRSRHDYAVEAKQAVDRIADKLRNQVGDDSDAWREFIDYLHSYQ